MDPSPFDLFVIGAGSGGVRAARMAAQRGARVAVADPAPLGGTCVNLGCIPKKLYRYAADYGAAFDEARGYGWTADAPRFDWDTLKANRAAEITRLNGVYAALLESAGVTVLRGRARLHDAHTVAVGDARHAARHVLVATGGAPVVPPWPGRELAITSDQVFDLPRLPRRLLVVGGGYIACEFASIFRGLGVEVVQVLRADEVLRGFDDDVRAFVGEALRRQGIELRTGVHVARLDRHGDGVRTTLHEGGTIDADGVLAATGRAPRTFGLGLAEVGVALGDNGAVRVDADYRSSVPHIHAVGDVIDRLPLTPVALAEAMVVVDRLFGSGTRSLDYAHVPTAVFTHPEVASVGLAEAEARARHGAVRVFRSTFRPLRHTLTGHAERTLVKLVVDAASDRVVGVHMAGEHAAEIVQGFATALVAGATKAQFDATVGIHPTAAEEFVTMREAVA
jgi:glutathione reductase (NADPH)